MPRYNAQTGGVFGSGLYPDSRPQIDIGSGVDAVTRGATSLIQNAYQRRLTDEQRQIQAQERARAHSREDVLDARSAEEFNMRKDEHAATMAASGYTPGHTETTSAVEPGEIKSNGLLGPKGTVTAPKATTNTQTIQGAYDYRKSANYQIATETRSRKALEFSHAYKQVHPEATDAEALQFGLYASENPSIADNFLYPHSDPTAVHAENRQYDIKHPLPPRGGAGSASSPIGKALSTAKQRVDRNARDQQRVHAEVTKRFPSGLEDAGSAADTADYQRMHAQDSTLQAEGGRFRAVQDSLATRQLRDTGLTPKTDSTAPKPKNNGGEEKRLRQLAANAIANGADSAAVNKRLTEQLKALRTK